ncbi:WW domain-binding protein 11-like [Ruditapes philippinarum]|uniref:WW domain-binding protein 11-like n=1 Tax=Ruditapes philippinarum TaxID=129788 RepID=UPI00295BF3E9|nr:WW domain-binding protein 11-like [Ruditapes philippinarum]
MLKFLVVCLCAIAVAKWSQKVQAESDVNDLNDEEKRLLQTLEDAIDTSKRDTNDPCSEECGEDNECYEPCTCFYDCMADIDDEQRCEDDCSDDNVQKRMALAARNQERANDEIQSNNKNKQQKKLWGIPPIRIPPVPPVRRWVPPVRIPPVRIPPIPPVRRWVPPVRIPPVRIPPVPPVRRWIPPVRGWGGKK